MCVVWYNIFMGEKHNLSEKDIVTKFIIPRTPTEIVKVFGIKNDYLAALRELENEIYRVA